MEGKAGSGTPFTRVNMLLAQRNPSVRGRRCSNSYIEDNFLLTTQHYAPYNKRGRLARRYELLEIPIMHFPGIIHANIESLGSILIRQN